MKSCRSCGAELIIGISWGEGSARKNDYICRPCVRRKVKARAATRRAEINAQRRERYRLNRESELASNARYRRENPELIRDMARRYYETHKSKIAAQNQRWQEANPEKVRASKQKWAAANSDLKRAWTAQRRARLKSLTHPDADLDAIRAIYKQAVRMAQLTGYPWHVDHVKPLSQGGLHHQNNLVVLRADLNLRKGAREWPWLTWFLTP